ncbi:hypothetical protein GCM10028814_13110 [Angustibacter aerolatus]
MPVVGEGGHDPDDADRAAAERLPVVRSELRFELQLLHERVNSLLAAEAFLTIAYTAALANGTAWGQRFALVVGPVLSVLGLLLALLAWPGVATTVRMVLGWTRELAELVERSPATRLLSQAGDARSVRRGQWRSMLFFRAVPALFVVVWAVLTVVALVLPR